MNELVNVIIDENEKISGEIIRIPKSVCVSLLFTYYFRFQEEFFEFLKRNEKLNEEDETVRTFFERFYCIFLRNSKNKSVQMRWCIAS